MSRQREIEKQYILYQGRKNRFIWLAGVLTIILGLTGLALGPGSISISDLVAVLTGAGDQMHQGIIFQIRLPRVLAGILSGIALSVSGVVMQSVLRNPLGSPFTLGISNAAAFGAALAIIAFGAGSMYSSSTDAVMIANPYIVTASAFAWSLVACFLILFVARRRGATPENIDRKSTRLNSSPRIRTVMPSLP